jgi:hypothetical protein
MQEYEYKTVVFPEQRKVEQRYDATLNQMAAQGWRLVAAFAAHWSHDDVAIFERQIGQ